MDNSVLAALSTAGWEELSEHEREWVVRRLSGQDDVSTGGADKNNPGRLRSNNYANRGRLVEFDRPEIGYRALVDASRRAAFCLGAAVPPDIPLQRLGDRYQPGAPDLLDRADSGDLSARVAADMAMTGAVRDLRQQWEAFDRIGVGRAILPEARGEAAAWRRFRDSWDAGELGASEPGWYGRTGREIKERVGGANQILRAGAWKEGGPERRRLDRIRRALGEYRARHETAGLPAPQGDGALVGGHDLRLQEVEAVQRDLDRLSEPVWHAPGDLGALEIKVGIAVGWSWFGAPSDAARETFSQLMHDWADFEKDGVPEKLPWLRETHGVWLEFKRKWLAEDADVTELSAMVADANRVRRDLADVLQKQAAAEAKAAKEAEAKGQLAEAEAAKARAEDARRAAAATAKMGDIQAPDIEQTTDPLRAISDPLRFIVEETSQRLRGLSAAASEVGRSIRQSISVGWAAIPLQVKIGAGAILGLSTYAALRR